MLALKTKEKKILDKPIGDHRPTYINISIEDLIGDESILRIVTRHYPLQRQLEHGTTNRLLLHLLICHIILSNHLLHSATRIPLSATFWKPYLPEELSSSARC